MSGRTRGGRTGTDSGRFTKFPRATEVRGEYYRIGVVKAITETEILDYEPYWLFPRARLIAQSAG